MAEESQPKVTYWAISILSSKTAWVALATFIVGVMALPEVTNIIPLRWMPVIQMITGVLMFALRTVTVRPVALIAPGETKPVEVDKIGPPPPDTLTA